MDPKYWSKPVTVETMSLGKYRTVTNTKDATRILMTQWPRAHGRRLSKAKKTCFSVLEGAKPPSDARRAFIDAAYEADLNIREQ